MSGARQVRTRALDDALRQRGILSLTPVQVCMSCISLLLCELSLQHVQQPPTTSLSMRP